MRIFGTAKEFNWKYAVGEVLLIVVGVSIALATNSWYENRQLRSDEIAALTQLQATLREDLKGITRTHETMGRINQEISLFVSVIESDQSNKYDLTKGIRSNTRFVTLHPSNGPYESLKARGIDLISNKSLRTTITSLYEDEIPNLVEDSIIDRQLVREIMLPAILEWAWLDSTDNWIPKDTVAEGWRSDLATLGRHRARTLNRFYLPSFERTIELMREALADIDAELTQRN